MLSSILKEHKSEFSKLKAASNEAKHQATGTAVQFSKELHKTNHDQIKTVAEQQQLIDTEVTTLTNAASHFVRHSESWSIHAEKLHDATKNLGDIENWVSAIEWDIQATLRILQNIQNSKRDKQDSE
ncbi:hypothetical protein GEMRC1_013994 [Eukaryota sp. GEM-RC1]